MRLHNNINLSIKKLMYVGGIAGASILLSFPVLAQATPGANYRYSPGSWETSNYNSPSRIQVDGNFGSRRESQPYANYGYNTGVGQYSNYGYPRGNQSNGYYRSNTGSQPYGYYGSDTGSGQYSNYGSDTGSQRYGVGDR